MASRSRLDHRFQFWQIYAGSDQVQKSCRDTISNSRQLLVNEFFCGTDGSKSDHFPRKKSKILTWSQMTRNDAGSSKITLVLSWDDNSTFSPFCRGLEKILKKKILKTEARDHFQTHFWVLRSHFSLGKFDSRSMWPSVPNLTEIDENPRKMEWNFDLVSNDSEWPRELRNHLGMDLRWKFNFCSLLTSPRDKSWQNWPKRNEISTMAQTTQNDPGSSKITLKSTSDENSTFAHFCRDHEKSLKNENENTLECNGDLKSTWKSGSGNLEDQNANSEIEIWDHLRNCDIES